LRAGVDNVDVAARDRVSGKAMKMVPNGVAYETGANPAIVDAEFFHGCKQHYNVPLSFKELGDVVESLHADQANQSPTHSVVRNGSSSACRRAANDVFCRFSCTSDSRPRARSERVVRTGRGTSTTFMACQLAAFHLANKVVR
jgi:hypothetical protein